MCFITYSTKMLKIRNFRRFATHNSTAMKTSPKTLTKKPLPHLIDQDYIGPPDKVSNLRPYVRHIEENESDLKKRLRETQDAVEKWNQEFWTNHNNRFYNEKKKYMQEHELAENEQASADKLSEFYKTFLDENKKLHFLYNTSWYAKNFKLLLLSLRVEIEKILSKK